MGQGQSSGGESAQSQVNTSYYELLGVDRHATEDELKKAYRRKALELHPDRNFGNVDNATQLFAEVQAAYDVLSDPQERAWYDSHESAILRGDDGGAGEQGAQQQHYERNVRLTTADELARVILKFNARVEFSDASTGFFGFLRTTFDDLVEQEAAVAASAAPSNPSDVEAEVLGHYPSFGTSDDVHEDVRPFYAIWASFATRRSYAWVDRFRPSDAPDRRTRRLIEKDNRKARDDAVREFNDAVRALIEFARKRDPRYKPSTHTDTERQKTLREAAAAQRARARAANEAKLKDQVVPDWAKATEAVHEEAEAGEDEWNEDEEDAEEFECVACRKTFKSEKQFEAHEKSKKHQKAIHALKRKMRKENQSLELDDFESSGVTTPLSAEDGERADAEASEEELDMHGVSASVKAVQVEVDEPPAEDLLQSDEKTEIQNNIRTTSSFAHDERVITADDYERESDNEGDEHADYAPRSKVEARLSGAERSEAGSASHIPDENTMSTSPRGPKMGKAAQKRAKKAAQENIIDQAGSKFTCATCKTPFTSKTRMFQHIKDFGHAAPVQQPASKSNKGGKRK